MLTPRRHAFLVRVINLHYYIQCYQYYIIFSCAAAKFSQFQFKASYMCPLSVPQKKWMWEKRGAEKWFMVIPSKVAPVIGTALRTAGPVSTDSRQ